MLTAHPLLYWRFATLPSNILPTLQADSPSRTAPPATCLFCWKATALDLVPSAVPELHPVYDLQCGLRFDECGALVQDCPRVHIDLCRATFELADTLVDARLPERASRLRNEAAQRYGCCCSVS